MLCAGSRIVVFHIVVSLKINHPKREVVRELNNHICLDDSSSLWDIISETEISLDIR